MTAILRNVFFYDLRDLDTLLGGLCLTHGVTNTSFYSMINIVLIISSDYFIQNEKGESLPRDSEPLLPGNYFIVADGTVDVNDEIVLTRTMSLGTGTRIQEFKESVRNRDGRCVVTGVENIVAKAGLWQGFEAAHIFPLAYEQHWKQHNFARWITLPPTKGGTINSVQNGILLQANLHQLFNSYYFALNPDVSFFFFFFRFYSYFRFRTTTGLAVFNLIYLGLRANVSIAVF